MEFKREIAKPQDVPKYVASIAKDTSGYVEDRKAVIRSLQTSKLVFVTKDLVEVAESTYETKVGSDILDYLPSRSGFLVYEGGAYYRYAGEVFNDGGYSPKMSAVQWHVEGRRLYLTGFSAILSEEVEASRDVKRRVAKRWGTAPVPHRTSAREIGPGWVDTNLTYQERLFFATILLLQSKGVSRNEEREYQPQMPKGYRGKPAVDMVSVNYLRPLREVHATEDSGRRLNVRFIVCGHFRNQPYKSTGEVKRIFIDPYIKGPEGAPLKTFRSVYVADRKSLR